MAREIKTQEQYLGKLLKLIPSEIVAAYMAIQGFVPDENAKWGLTVVAALLFIITPFYLKRVQNVEKNSQVFVSTLSFIVWVYAIGGPFAHWEMTQGESIHEPWIASIVILLWTTFIPQFFTTKPVQNR